jgi:hypothetical protein
MYFPALALRDWRKPRQTPVRIVGAPAAIQMEVVPIANEKRYCFSELARPFDFCFMALLYVWTSICLYTCLSALITPVWNAGCVHIGFEVWDILQSSCWSLTVRYVLFKQPFLVQISCGSHMLHTPVLEITTVCFMCLHLSSTILRNW